MSPRSRRRRRGPDAPLPLRSRASSGAGSTAPRSRRGRRPAAAVRSGRTGRAGGPSARAPRRARRCRSRRPPRARPCEPGESSASTSAVVAPMPDEKRSASPPSSSPSARSASTRSGARSARSGTARARRRCTARWSSGRAAAPCRESTARIVLGCGGHGRDARHHRRQARVAAGALRAGGARRQRAGGRAPAGAGQAARTRAGREAARPGLVRRARPLRPPPQPRLRLDGEPAVRRRGRHRVRRDLRPQGLRLLAGLHRLRRLALRGLRREDLQGDGHGREVRLPGDRDQRLRRRADPGRRRLARRLRRDLLAQRAGLGRRPADLARAGAVRRRRRLLARDHRLRAHGRGELVHVHHRPRRREDGDRRGGFVRGARGRRDARVQVRRRALHRRRRGGMPRGRALPALVPAAEQPRAARRTPRRPIPSTARRRSSTRSSRTSRRSRTT